VTAASRHATIASRSATVQPEAVRRKVQAWIAEKDGTRAIALGARPEWAGEPVITVDGEAVRVVPCPTPIAARAALHDRVDGERLVLLTDLHDMALGDGVLAHVSQQTVRSVEPWDLVRQMFGRAALDPRLVRTGKWVPAALGDFVPPEGWPSPPGTVVTRDHVLRCLAAEVLGVARDRLDSAGLLEWSTDAPAQLRFISLPEPVADGLTAYLVELAGLAAVPIMAAVRARHGVDAIALGLIAGVIWPHQATSDTDVRLAVARTRLEPRLGGVRLTQAQATAFHQAAEAWVYRTVDSGARGETIKVLRRAEAIAAELEVTSLLGSSVLLPAGFRQRMHTFAGAVRLAVPAGGTAVSDAVTRVQAALAEVEAHRAADPVRVETARMAVRLLRWLAAPDGTAPATLLEALHRQVREDGWVDRARLDVFAGDPDPVVADVYRLLHKAADTRRARHDQQFATLLTETTAAESPPGTLLRVEDVLDRVVRPIVQRGRRVLLVVMDGMSVAAATELADSVTRSGSWAELTPEGGLRTGVLAALPTVTEVSRCSLLSGRIATGGQAEERAAFQQAFPGSVLLHKGALRSAAGAALDADVQSALGDPAVPVVAAVVNTIDDALDRSDPGTTVWTDDTIRAVRHLLASAQDRVVVLVSDHGHVIDRGPESVVLPSESSENRWRPATSPPRDGEIAIRGSRVAAAGGSVVLPWREELRYGPRKAGYHGGASPAEAVIPLLLFSAVDDAGVPGWADAPVAAPGWWREPLPEAAPNPSAAPSRRTQPAGRQSEALFDLAPQTPPAASPPQGPSLIDALLASDLYRQRRDARAPLPDERVAALLGILVAGSGRASLDSLAAQAGIPAHRIAGTITALRKLLQVEGYPVLTLDADGQTVKLDRSLLIEQFHLEPS
jgi:hypothetical protein